jgi:glycosyltransferase involved in cell wall biosynthesis
METEIGQWIIFRQSNHECGKCLPESGCHTVVTDSRHPPDRKWPSSEEAVKVRIAIVTDAWSPQTNGVVKTLSMTASQATLLGHQVLVIEPSQFRTLPCPTYPEIRLACFPCARMDRELVAFGVEAIHIATEGPLGMSARKWCLRQGVPFTTSYHTQFPEYVQARFPIPLSVSYSYLRRFHGAARCTMVATPSMQRLLEGRRFRNLARWTRGVDVELFRPRAKEFLAWPRPIAIYVGRIALEKNIEAFMTMPWSGTKVVVGDGPARAELESEHPEVRFTGYRYGEELARFIAAADVFVFPSRTDTFGLVLLEAMACGVPVAAYPVTGPIDVVLDGVTGSLDEDLARAARAALHLDPVACRRRALENSWEVATRQFLANMAPFRPRGAHVTATATSRPT